LLFAVFEDAEVGFVEAADGRPSVVDRIDREGDEAGFELERRKLVGGFLRGGAALDGSLGRAERRECDEGYEGRRSQVTGSEWASGRDRFGTCQKSRR